MGLKGFEHGLKRLGFRLITHFAPGPGRSPTAADLRKVRKALVVRLDDRIGNTILLTPLLISLKTAFPGMKISCLLSKRFRELAAFLPAVDRCIPYDKKAYARNPLKLWGIVRSLQKEKFELVFDASDELELSFNHAVVTAFSGGRFRIGYNRRGSARWLETAINPGDPGRHATQMHLDLLRALAEVPDAPRPALNVSQVNSYGAHFRQSHNIPANVPLVVIHPGGRGPKRRPLGRFVELAGRIGTELGARPVFIWGPAEDEMMRAACTDLPQTIVAAGNLRFEDLISLFHVAAAYVSNDNGIMHLAAACGVPTVGIFVVSNLAKYRPLGPLDRAFDEAAQPVELTEIVGTLRGMLEETAVDRTATEPAVADPRRR
jgi:heptosyltransferase-2